MVNYKLIYFDGRGRAEVARLLFAVSGTKYEDQRVPRDDWPKLKPSTPFGQVPVLDVDGAQLCQSNAINRYLAKKFGLAGKNDLDAARADMIVDCIEDMLKPVTALFSEKDDAVKNEKKKKFAEETFPEYLEKFEKLLVSNNGGSGYFVGDGLTWADLAFAQLVTFPGMFGIDANFAKAPKLKALKERVEANPKIAEWIKNRPQTPF